jgi:hypothetical protein
MKTMKLAILGSALLLVFASPLRVQAAEVSDVIADHQATATSYEQKAAQQDALIKEHVEMKKTYAQRYTPGNASKIGVPSKVKQMEKHCNAIVKDATKLRNELLDFAKWHRMRAAELEGR